MEVIVNEKIYKINGMNKLVEGLRHICILANKNDKTIILNGANWKVKGKKLIPYIDLSCIDDYHLE